MSRLLRPTVLACVVLLALIILFDGSRASAQTSGLVAAYGFDESSGNIVADVSGNNNTGTLGTGVTRTTQGKFGSALIFNGASFVTIPHSASLNLTTGMTLEAWVFPTATPTSWATALMKEQAGQLVYTLYAGSPANRPNVYFNTGTAPSTERGVAGPSALPLNTWSHLAGTFDGAILRLYVNGALVTSQAFAGSIVTSTGALRIGGNAVWGEYFQGHIDDVRLYNRALSLAEIQTDMNTPVGGAPPPDTTPPTTPSNLTATAVSGSQINLGWTASTDNVGVTGYPVERCQGTGCGTFAPIGTATGTTFNDTGLTPNTSYSYRVRATDAAANPSAYSNTASATTAATIPGLVAAYPFNESSGTTVTDVSGNSNTGTLGAGVTRTTQGKFGSALVFNGASFVTIPHSASLNLTPGMTLEAWVFPTGTLTNWATALMKEQAGNLVYTLYAGSPANRPNAYFSTGTSSSTQRGIAGPSALPLNTWSHLAGTFDGATLRLYVNGALVASQAFAGPIITSTGALRIGGNAVWGEYFQGRLDDVRLYNRALSLAEVQTDMNTPVGGAPPPDTTPPTVAVTAPTSGATYTTNATPVTLSGTAADSVGVTEVTWTNSSGGSGTATGTTAWSASNIALQPGSNVLTVTARDAANNPGTATLTVTYDPTAPTASIAVPTTDPTFTATTSPLTLGGSAADNLGVTQVTWANNRGGSGTASGTTTWSATGITLQPGTNVLTVTARDAANNPGTATLTVTYAVPDTTPPTVAITAPTAGSTYSTNATPLTLGGTAADSVGVTDVTWTNDRGGSGTASGTTSWSAPGIALQPGPNVLTVTARDAASNPGTATLTVTYDPTAPTVSLTAPTSGATVSGTTTTISATAADNIAVGGVQFLLDGAPLGAEQTSGFSLSWNTTGTPNGPHTLSARARDAAGNTTLAADVPVTVSNAQPTGLVAAYAFNETSGNTVTDVSGNNNTGTLGAGVTRTTQGKNGNALVFNGASFVTIPHSASLNLTTGMTLEAWVFPTATPTNWATALMKEQTGNLVYTLYAGSPANRPSVYFSTGAASSTQHGSTGLSALLLNTWSHLAGTFDGGTLRLYVNGALVTSQAFTGPIVTSTGALRIGGNAVWGEYFQGRIDDVRLYNRALALAEIQTDMNTPVGGAPPPDATPPTIAITAPALGSSVFGLVSVAANASDNVSVAGVQFLLDNAPLGIESTDVPYSVVWDASSAQPGSTHVLKAVARDFAGNTTTSAPVSVTVAATSPSLVGQWAATVSWPIVAVHATLLPTGEVLASDGQSFAGNDARLWNPTTNAFTAVRNNNTNIFCSGHCALADGRTLFAGGHVGVHTGVRDTNIFNPQTRTWSLVASMAYDRWYPTVTTLPDGRVLVTAGEAGCAGCDVEIPEIYNPQTNTWAQLSSAPLALPYYPHMFVLPDGRLLAASTTEHPIITQTLDLATQTWSVVDPGVYDGGSAVMYLPGKVMKSGTSYHPDDPVVPSGERTFVLDMTSPLPAWQETAPMVYPRTYHTLTLLPDGTVLATGGGVTTDAVAASDAVHPAELWSPVTQTWSTMASLQTPRLYHSTALLLPDARVLVAGGGRFFGQPDATDLLSAQIYSPPYFFKGARPVTTSVPATTTYGAHITVQTPDASRIAAVSLIRLGSVTHSFNMDQRYLQLPFTFAGGSLDIQAPANANLAPPGHYMLFILDGNGVPSVAAIVRLQ